MARPADDGALGRARSRRGPGHASRNRGRLPRGIFDAAAAYRAVRQSAGAQPRPHVAQEEAGRDRPDVRRQGAGLMPGIGRRLVAEALGTAFLLAAVVGSGIMGERLADGNAAIALLANSLATGAALVVLISILGPISGAHFNPAVTLFLALRREIGPRMGALYVAAQLAGALAGVWVAHAMFAMPVVEMSAKLRDGPAQWLAEFVATFGLMATIAGAARYMPG